MKTQLFAAVLLSLLIPASIMADGYVPDRSGAGTFRADEEMEPGSDASFDKRLPPVYAGEYVKDGARKKRVWSTSGPVVGRSAPVAPSANGRRQGGAVDPGRVSVIVDRRGDGNQAANPHNQPPAGSAANDQNNTAPHTGNPDNGEIEIQDSTRRPSLRFGDLPKD